MTCVRSPRALNILVNELTSSPSALSSHKVKPDEPHDDELGSLASMTEGERCLGQSTRLFTELGAVTDLVLLDLGDFDRFNGGSSLECSTRTRLLFFGGISFGYHT